MNRILLIVSIIWASVVNAQQVQISYITQNAEDKSILVEYSLSSNVKGTIYQVEVYSSIDNYILPLKGVYGDIGFNVEEGQRQFKWNYYEDIEEFKGEISFKIKAVEQYVPVLWLATSIPNVQKRKKSYELEWKGGFKKDLLSIQLMKGDSVCYSLDSITNNGLYKLKIPKEIKKGLGYSYTIYPMSQKEKKTPTKEFTIKSKTPVLVSVGVPVLFALTWVVIYDQMANNGDLLNSLFGGEKSPEPLIEQGGGKIENPKLP